MYLLKIILLSNWYFHEFLELLPKIFLFPLSPSVADLMHNCRHYADFMLYKFMLSLHQINMLWHCSYFK